MLRLLISYFLWTVTILMLVQAKSHAATIDCVAIENGQLLQVDAISPHYNNCLELTGLDLSKPLAVTVFSADKTTSKLSVYGGSSSTTTQKLLDKVSDSDGIMSFSTNVHSGKSSVQFKLSTFNKATQNKSLTVFYTKDQSANIISIVVESKRITVSNTPPGDGGYCNPKTRICYEPNSVVFLQAATACSGALAPPPGMPANFNLAEHAAYFTKAGNLIDATSASANISKARKLSIVTALFAPYSVYDVKHGTVYQGDEVAGNYIFGYLGSAFGYNQTDLVRLGAVAQQYQNLLHSKLAVSQQWNNFYEGMKQAVGPNPAAADNPGDSEKIMNGQLAQQSGCNTSSQSNTSVTGGGGGEGGGNWASSGSFIIVGNVCSGYCYGIPRVTITDLP